MMWLGRRPRILECLLTMRRIYETERGDPRCSPKRGFVLSPGPAAPDVCGHKPFRLQPAGHPPRASTPFADSPAIGYQAVQQVMRPDDAAASDSCQLVGGAAGTGMGRRVGWVGSAYRAFATVASKITCFGRSTCWQKKCSVCATVPWEAFGAYVESLHAAADKQLQSPHALPCAAQHYWGNEGSGGGFGGGGEGNNGVQNGVAKAMGVTKLMKQCTAMLRERMGDSAGGSSDAHVAAARCALSCRGFRV